MFQTYDCFMKKHKNPYSVETDVLLKQFSVIFMVPGNLGLSVV